MKVLLLTVLLLPSCAIVRWAVGESSHANRASSPTTVTESSNKSLWLGLSADDLILHPVFATKKMARRQASNGTEVITFINEGGFGSSCNHVFYLTENKITDYQRVGQCSEVEDPQLRPKK